MCHGCRIFRQKADLCMRLADGLSLNNPGRFQLMDMAEELQKHAAEVQRKQNNRSVLNQRNSGDLCRQPRRRFHNSDPARLIARQAMSGPSLPPFFDCLGFSGGWPIQAGRPLSSNSLCVIPQTTQALDLKSKRCPRAVRLSGICRLDSVSDHGFRNNSMTLCVSRLAAQCLRKFSFHTFATIRLRFYPGSRGM